MWKEHEPNLCWVHGGTKPRRAAAVALTHLAQTYPVDTHPVDTHKHCDRVWEGNIRNGGKTKKIGQSRRTEQMRTRCRNGLALHHPNRSVLRKDYVNLSHKTTRERESGSGQSRPSHQCKNTYSTWWRNHRDLIILMTVKKLKNISARKHRTT